MHYFIEIIFLALNKHIGFSERAITVITVKRNCYGIEAADLQFDFALSEIALDSDEGIDGNNQI